MYVTEYRKALRDAGFDGFRVMLFQQTGGLKQATGEERGLLARPRPSSSRSPRPSSPATSINVIGYRIRPYEVVKGAADEALDGAKEEVYDALENQHQRGGRALSRARKILAAVEVDRLQRQAEGRGARRVLGDDHRGRRQLPPAALPRGARAREVDIQVIANLLLYNLWEFTHDTKDRAWSCKRRRRRQVRPGGHRRRADPRGALPRRARCCAASGRTLRVWAVGFADHPLPDMDEVASSVTATTTQELRGGEGHMEVAKLILNVVKQKAHMTLSVKPFGCMPSSSASRTASSRVITERSPRPSSARWRPAATAP